MERASKQLVSKCYIGNCLYTAHIEQLSTVDSISPLEAHNFCLSARAHIDWSHVFSYLLLNLPFGIDNDAM